ncbi:MAG: 3'(2'),5'-bisphosphate nucleotidase CysQ [Holophagales bacterium]|nr:3'(2'),5'-bisphosphate nucleotidase CysQ [Holophagales bacterium]
MYHSGDLGVREKADQSPVTRADLASQEVLLAGLKKLAPEIPVLSEEAALISWAERREWRRLWLVDPLDGTRELLKGNGELTVNVALIEDGEPVLGVVLAPVLDRCYLGATRAHAGADRAWRIDGGGPRSIHASGTGSSRPKVVASRSHRNHRLEALLAELPLHETVAMGSSLKFCLVAEGAADLYPRTSPTMEWDTAAAHAVLRAAGGEVIGPSGEPLRYNRESLRNPPFIAHGSDTSPWPDDLVARISIPETTFVSAGPG